MERRRMSRICSYWIIQDDRSHGHSFRPMASPYLDIHVYLYKLEMSFQTAVVVDGIFLSLSFELCRMAL